MKQILDVVKLVFVPLRVNPAGENVQYLYVIIDKEKRPKVNYLD